MSKFGVGVGEEFPVEDAKPPQSGGPEQPERRRHWRGHHLLHVLTRLALIALMISAIAWLFRPHYAFYPDPYFPYAAYGYPHHFFFPFFPVLLVAILLAFAWRR